MNSAQQARLEALAELGRALESMQVGQRGPDPWERFYMVHAFQAFFSGLYQLAAFEAGMAAVPPRERAGVSRTPFGPALASCGLPVLLRAFDEAVKAELITAPTLGPVSLDDPDASLRDREPADHSARANYLN